MSSAACEPDDDRSTPNDVVGVSQSKGTDDTDWETIEIAEKENTGSDEGAGATESDMTSTALTSLTKSSGKTGNSNEILCGYLNKLTGKGPLRGFKKRWFVHSNSDCKLKYYRAKGDLVPMGEIDIRRATFSISPISGTDSNSLVFTITTLDKEYVLEGVDQQTTLFWIRELQRQRKEYIVNLASNFGITLSSPPAPRSQSESDHQPQVTEVRSVRSNSRFYVDSDFFGPSSHSVDLKQPPQQHFKPKRSMTEDSLSHPHQHQQQQHQSRSPLASTSSATGFNLFTRVKNRAESLTRQSNTKTGCEKCREKEEQLVSMSDDLTAVENELQATREVVHLLQRQLDVVQREKLKLQDIVKNSAGSGNTDQMLATISNLELELGDTNAKLKSTQRMLDRLNNEYEKLDEEKKRLIEEISVLRDTIDAKDKTVISLTNEIFELEASGQPSLRASVMTPPPHHLQFDQKLVKVESSETDQLKDSLQAYKMQNEFLNQEIVAVNELRIMSEKKVQELQLKSYEWEAKCCQIQSKLLSLLKEINASINASTYEDERDPQSPKKEAVVSEQTIDLVKRLLDDISLNVPLSWQKGNRGRDSAPTLIAAAKFSQQDYDDLGFSNRDKYERTGSCNGSIDQDEQEREDLEAEEAGKKRANLSTGQITSDVKEEAAGQQQRVTARQSWKSRWDNYVATLGSGELQRSQELKYLLRSGIPREYRCKIWKGLINLRVKTLRDKLGPDYYRKLIMANSNNSVTSKSQGSKSYDPHAKQIELDLLRTLPNNKHFESLESDGTCRLRRVLQAYSRHNPVVGYCQGINRLAAVSLLFMPEEEGK